MRYGALLTSGYVQSVSLSLYTDFMEVPKGGLLGTIGPLSLNCPCRSMQRFNGDGTFSEEIR